MSLQQVADLRNVVRVFPRQLLAGLMIKGARKEASIVEFNGPAL
jgi:hypothetical protein